MQVTLVSSTANYVGCTIEEFIVYTARVSSNKPKDSRHEGAKTLLKYMLKNGHWSPFEQVNIGFNVVTTRAISAQICRHKSLSVQELSQRYKEIEWEDFEFPEIRIKNDGGNRQGSGGVADRQMESITNKSIERSFEVYDALIANNIAPESARMVLPMCTPTEMYLNGSLRSWIHFLTQRLDGHAQKEIRDIAKLIHIELVKLFPITFEILKESYQKFELTSEPAIVFKGGENPYLMLFDGKTDDCLVDIEISLDDFRRLFNYKPNIWE